MKEIKVSRKCNETQKLNKSADTVMVHLFAKYTMLLPENEGEFWKVVNVYHGVYEA